MQLKMMMLTLMMILVITPTSEKLITLAVTLVMTALMVTLLISILFNSWFAFILFLIYITGLLVIFSYMLAMSPNTRRTKISLGFLGFPMLLYFFGFVQLVWIPNSSVSFEWKVLSLFSFTNSNIYWGMTLILLLALVVVVSMCYKSPSPLRPFL